MKQLFSHNAYGPNRHCMWISFFLKLTFVDILIHEWKDKKLQKKIVFTGGPKTKNQEWMFITHVRKGLHPSVKKILQSGSFCVLFDKVFTV